MAATTRSTTEHHHQLRAQVPKKSTWWRAVAAVGLSVTMTVAPLLIEERLSNGVDALLGLPARQAGELTTITPGLLLVNNVLMSMAPAYAAVALKIVYGRTVDVGRILSNAGRWRVRWMRSALLPATLLGTCFTLGLRFCRPFGPMHLSTRSDWALLSIALLSTPIEATAEEIYCRGFLQQLFAAPISSSDKAFWLSTGLVSALFASMHLAADPWYNVWYMLAGLVNSLMTRQTGGIETSSVYHSSFNLMLIVPILLSRNHGLLLDRANGVGGPALLPGILTAVLAPLVTRWYVRSAHSTLDEGQDHDHDHHHDGRPDQVVDSTSSTIR